MAVGTEFPGTNSPNVYKKLVFKQDATLALQICTISWEMPANPDGTQNGKLSLYTWDQIYPVWLSGILFCICLFCCKGGAKCHGMRVIYYLLSLNNAKTEKEWISPFFISVTAYKVRVVFLQCQPWTAEFFLHLLLTFPLQIIPPWSSVPAATTCHSAAAAFHPLQWFTAFLWRRKAISKCKCTSQHSALETFCTTGTFSTLSPLNQITGAAVSSKVCCFFYGSWRVQTCQCFAGKWGEI